MIIQFLFVDKRVRLALLSGPARSSDPMGVGFAAVRGVIVHHYCYLIFFFFCIKKVSVTRKVSLKKELFQSTRKSHCFIYY